MAAPLSQDKMNKIVNNFTTNYVTEKQKDVLDGPPDKKIDHTQNTNHQNLLRKEAYRLSTFNECTGVLKSKAESLALCGFFYRSEGDQCECKFCGVVIEKWRIDDEPLDEHLKYSERCPLLTLDRVDNEPINVDKFNELINRSKVRSHDVCGFGDMIYKPDSVPETALSNQSPSLSNPEYPSYRIESVRLESFKDWPRLQFTQKPADLADAGFYYTGTGDRVICFQCGGGLKDWDKGDDPWEQHALWYNNCEFLKLRKGVDYIKEIKQKHTNDVELGQSSVDVEEDIIPSPVNINDDGEEKESKKLCVICLDREYNTVYIPCGHVVACDKCASSVPKCPLCRKKYDNAVRIYFH